MMSKPFLTACAAACAAALFAATAPLATEAVPEENVTKGAAPPAFETAADGAKRLLAAICAGDPSLAADFFFPAAAFDLVKAMAVPGRYHRKLVTWYGEDILAESPRFRGGAWEFKSLEKGRCKWQEKGTEGNALPYWSCRGNRVIAQSGERTRTFDIHVMINWGKSWYVTHLGKIRK